MKSMKSLFALMICLLLSAGLMAQETKPAQKKIHIQIEKNVNGEMTTIDTVIHVDNEAEAHFIMKDMGIDSEQGAAGEESVKIIRFKGGEMDPAIQSEVHEALEKAGIDPAEWNQEGEGAKKMIIIRHSETDGADAAQQQVWIDADGTTHPLGEGREVRMIIKNGEGDIETENVWIDDAKGVHKIETADGKHMIMIKTDGELTEAEKAEMKAAIEKGEGLQQEITVDVEEIENSEGKMVRTIKIVRLRAEIKDLEAADIKQLSATGADASRLKNTLEVADLSFYPNPNDGRFTLRFSAPESGATAVRIFDTTGRTVYEEKLGDFSGAYEKPIDISGEAKGVYFLTISQNDKLLNKKIVLE